MRRLRKSGQYEAVSYASSSANSRRTEQLQGSSDADIARAVELLRSGKLVAIPTETVYGLAANALDVPAVASIFEAKQRPGWDPLIVHVSDMAMLSRVVRDVPACALALMDRFWPGPLTLLLPRHPDLPSAVTAGRELVGVRMPAHPIAARLIRQTRLPLAAPSANRFGHISPTTAAHVLADLDSRIEAVVDGGATDIGVESTVLDPVARVLYREGGVTRQQLEHVLGATVAVYRRREDVMRPAATPESLPSPGVGMRHYAPRANVMLVHSQEHLDDLLQHVTAEQTGVMLPQDWKVTGWKGKVFAWERWGDPAALARTLYTGLRALDTGHVQTIICPLPPSSDEPLIEAIRDRLLKAARDA